MQTLEQTINQDIEVIKNKLITNNVNLWNHTDNEIIIDVITYSTITHNEIKLLDKMSYDIMNITAIKDDLKIRLRKKIKVSKS